jgi:hypothetical protein
MRVAILSESAADEAALRVLVDALLGVKPIAVETQLRSRGWTAVQSILPSISKQLHYRTDTDALVVVVDSNHTYLSGDQPKNRLREFQELVKRCRSQLKPVSGRVPLLIAVGVAAPAIEAWWLCGTHPQISEAAWEKGLDENQEPYSKLDLKKWLYGAENNSLEHMTEKMVAAARALENDLTLLERAFPHGFGSLAAEIRQWRRLG